MIISRYAQISIFVINSAIVLVLGIIFFVTISTTSLFQQDTPSFRIQEFTQQCLEQQVYFAFNEVGRKGGWYFTENQVPLFARQNDHNSIINAARGFEHIFYGNLVYWNYFDESSNQINTNIPRLDDESDPFSIRNQIIRLVEETINAQCLEDYASFSERYTIDVDINELEITSTTFEGNRVVFEMYLPVFIRDQEQGVSDSITTFRVDVDNKIRIPYYIANDIVTAQNEESFIELAMLDFIYNYQSTGNNDLLPPFYDFRYGVADYSVIMAEDKKPLLRQIFNTHLNEVIITDLHLTPDQENIVRLNQEAVFRPVIAHQRDILSNLESETFLNSQRLDREFSNHNARINFETFFPVSFSFSNGRGGGQILTHNVFNELLLIVPIQYTTYQAGYDVTIPILYQIESNSQTPDNFIFNLPLEVNIRNNNPVRDLIDSGIRTSSLTDSTSFSASFCNENHHISEDVVIDVSSFNRFGEREPLDNVEFTFSCSTQPSSICPISSQESQERFDSQEFVLQLPINCPDSRLEVSKDGFVSESLSVSPSLLNEVRERVTLTQPKELEFFFSIDGRTLGENQETFIMFEPINNPQYIQVFNFNSSTDFNNQNITLVPDTYRIVSLTFDNSSRIIPGIPGNRCSTFQRLTGCRNTPDLPDLPMEGWVLSSFDLENYIVNFEDIQFARRVIADLRGVTYPRSYDELQQEMPRSERRDIRIE